MLLLLALALQASPASGDGLADDIVVTGRRDRNAQFRLRALPDRFSPGGALPKAEVRLAANAKLAAESEKGEGPAQSNRAMVRLKLAF